MKGIDIQVLPPLKRQVIFEQFKTPGDDWEKHTIVEDETERPDLIFQRHYDFFEMTGLWIIFEAAGGKVRGFEVGQELYLPPLSWVRLQIIEQTS